MASTAKESAAAIGLEMAAVLRECRDKGFNPPREAAVNGCMARLIGASTETELDALAYLVPAYNLLHSKVIDQLPDGESRQVAHIIAALIERAGLSIETASGYSIDAFDALAPIPERKN